MPISCLPCRLCECVREEKRFCPPSFTSRRSHRSLTLFPLFVSLLTPTLYGMSYSPVLTRDDDEESIPLRRLSPHPPHPPTSSHSLNSPDLARVPSPRFKREREADPDYTSDAEDDDDILQLLAAGERSSNDEIKRGEIGEALAQQGGEGAGGEGERMAWRDPDEDVDSAAAMVRRVRSLSIVQLVEGGEGC